MAVLLGHISVEVYYNTILNYGNKFSLKDIGKNETGIKLLHKHYFLCIMFVARPIGEMVNTLPSQGNIHGFESHIGHHMLFKVPYLGTFFNFLGLTVEYTFNYNGSGGNMDCKCLECDCNVIHDEVVKKTLKDMPSDTVIKKIASFFKVIGDNTRAKILFALDSNEMCVCDIANVLNMTKSAVSHQLSVLKEERIVKFKRVGKEVYYSLDDEHVKEVYEVALSHVKEILDEKV